MSAQREYHIKGSAYLGTKKQYDALVPGGYAAVVAASDSSAAFALQEFFPSSWYDIRPMVRLDYTAAQLLGLTPREFAQRSVALQVQLDMRGIYKVALRFFSPETVIDKLSRFALTYFDFGKSSTKRTGPNAVEVVTEGVPGDVAEWFGFGAAFYSAACIQSAGAHQVTVDIDRVAKADPDPTRVVWRAQWEPTPRGAR